MFSRKYLEDPEPECHKGSYPLTQYVALLEVYHWKIIQKKKKMHAQHRKAFNSPGLFLSLKWVLAMSGSCTD